MTQLQVYQEKLIELLMIYIPKLLLAVLVLVLGFWAIKWIGKWIGNAMVKSKIDASLQKFLLSLTVITLKILLLISVASMIGIATTSFVALIGAAGLAIGLSLQGSLANLAGGVLILLFRPFQVGDFIQAQGQTGTVHAIQVFYTVLKTPDNKTIIIPNGALSNDFIINFSTEKNRRIDMTFGIGYDDDIKAAKNILLKLVQEDERIFKEPEPQVAVAELGESSINFTVKVWCKSSNYWNIYFDMQEKVKKSFDKAGISIPYPQRDVHLYTVSGN